MPAAPSQKIISGKLRAPRRNDEVIAFLKGEPYAAAAQILDVAGGVELRCVLKVRVVRPSRSSPKSAPQPLPVPGAGTSYAYAGMDIPLPLNKAPARVTAALGKSGMLGKFCVP